MNIPRPMQQPLTYRQIKSFVLRQSRLTKAQQLALQEYAQSYIYPFKALPIQDYLQHKPLEITQDIQTPLLEEAAQWHKQVIEIGFGNGDSLLSDCLLEPQTLFFGIEVHLPGVARLIHRSHHSSIQNLKIIRADAQQVLTHLLPSEFFDKVGVFFPDPWHKKKHNKRRIINAKFIENVVKILKINGIVHIATDWEDYANHIQSVLTEEKKLQPVTQEEFSKLCQARAKTAYEKRGLSLNHKIYEFIYRKG